MRSAIAGTTAAFRLGKRSFTGVALALCLLVAAAMSLSPAVAAEIPSDDEQDVLIRTTLMTFNDANMTGNYSVLLAKSSKEFQGQFTADKLSAAFESFRTKGHFFDDLVTEEYDSYEKAKINPDGQLELAGVFKSDGWEVKYRLHYFQNDNVWKMSGIKVDANKT